MTRFSFLTVLPLLAPYLLSVSSAPLTPSALETRAINCSDTSQAAVFDGSCWAQLDITSYLATWAPPQCGSDASGANCCMPSEPWSTCFLRLAKADSGYDCTKINLGTCNYDGSLDPNLDSSIKARVRYVMRTIFLVNTFFEDWYLAVNLAAPQAALAIDAIVAKVDPPKTSNGILGDILTALTAGLAFIPAVGPELSTAGKALVTGLQAAPGVAQAIWPSGTVNTQTIQIGDISAQLASQSAQTSAMLSAGLLNVMSDKAAFAAFSASGAWSGQAKLSLPDDVASMTTGLTTYVLSIALTSNKYVGTILPLNHTNSHDYDPFLDYSHDQLIYQNTTIPGGGLFFLTNNEKNTKSPNKDADSIVQDMMSSGWSTPAQLFQGSFECSAQGHYLGGNLVQFRADGSLDLSCFSQLNECYANPIPDAANRQKLGDRYPCIVAFADGGCPLRNCLT